MWRSQAGWPPSRAPLGDGEAASGHGERASGHALGTEIDGELSGRTCTGVFARRFDDAGGGVSPEFQVNAYSVSDDLRGRLRGDPAILALYGPRPEMLALADEIAPRYPALRVFLHDSLWTGTTRITLQPAGTSKGSGLRHLLDLHWLEPEDCMVFGDWHNDLHMFAVGGVNVAMANAVDEVKAAAEIVLDRTCEEDGVACFLEQQFLSGAR